MCVYPHIVILSLPNVFVTRLSAREQAFEHKELLFTRLLPSGSLCSLLAGYPTLFHRVPLVWSGHDVLYVSTRRPYSMRCLLVCTAHYFVAAASPWCPLIRQHQSLLARLCSEEHELSSFDYWTLITAAEFLYPSALFISVLGCAYSNLSLVAVSFIYADWKMLILHYLRAINLNQVRINMHVQFSAQAMFIFFKKPL